MMSLWLLLKRWFLSFIGVFRDLYHFHRLAKPWCRVTNLSLSRLCSIDLLEDGSVKVTQHLRLLDPMGQFQRLGYLGLRNTSLIFCFVGFVFWGLTCENSRKFDNIWQLGIQLCVDSDYWGASVSVVRSLGVFLNHFTLNITWLYHIWLVGHEFTTFDVPLDPTVPTRCSQQPS